MSAALEPRHLWKFFRAGGLDQVCLETAADFEKLRQLDPKLWVALSCPVKGLEFDQRTLELLDTDNDGRIRLPEILQAVDYIVANLKNPAEIIKGIDGLPLASIKESETGKALLVSARRILSDLNKTGVSAVTVEDVSNTVKIFANTKFNGDGIVPATAAPDDAIKKIIEEIIAINGFETDRSGQPGINQQKLDTFFAELQAFSDWWTTGEKDSGAEHKILPLGSDMPEVFAAFKAVAAKIDDFFARCKLAAFDPRATPAMNRVDAEYIAVGTKDLTMTSAELAAFPIQQIAPGAALRLTEALNPAWAEKIAQFQMRVVGPLLGKNISELSDADWNLLKARLAPYESWLGSKQGGTVEKLGIERVRAILQSSAKAVIADLIKQDLALAPEVAGIDNVHRLVRYYRDLFLVLQNFVNFAGFYDPKAQSIFDAGSLYLDQRTCHLCVRVNDINEHASIAGLSRLFLAYCNCTRPNGEKVTVAAAFTQGDSDYLMVGRRGVFIDRQGRDWDAVITKIIENPISIRQAFWAPYKRLQKFVEEQIEKFAASKDKESHEAATTHLTTAATATPAEKAAAPKKEPFDVARFAGIFAAIGLAIGAIGGALGAMLTAFTRLEWWQMPLAILGIMLVISGPSIIIALLKLRLRTLGPVLEGNGWAINGRVKINIPLGTSLTDFKRLPPHSKLLLNDPFEDKAAIRRRILFAFILLIAAIAVVIWQLQKYGVIHLPQVM